MTEREERELERLKTIDDYIEEFTKLEEASAIMPVKQLDKIINLLSKALCKKYKYVINYSAPYRKKQSWFSILKDKREEKRRKKEDEENKSEESVESMEKDQAGTCPSLSAPGQNPQEIEVLDEVPVNMLTEGKSEEEPQKE